MALNQRQQIVKMLDKMGNSHREIHTSNETRRSGLFNGIKNMRSKLLISMRKWHFNFQNITVNYAYGFWINFLVWNVLSSFPKVFCKFQMPQMPRSIEIRFLASGVNAVLFCLLYARSTGKHRWANPDFRKLQNSQSSTKVQKKMVVVLPSLLTIIIPTTPLCPWIRLIVSSRSLAYSKEQN